MKTALIFSALTLLGPLSQSHHQSTKVTISEEKLGSTRKNLSNMLNFRTLIWLVPRGVLEDRRIDDIVIISFALFVSL